MSVGYGTRDARSAPPESAGAQGAQSWAFFHFVLACGAAYGAMLLTNFGDIGASPAEQIASQSTTGQIGETSLWVRVVSQWVTVVLFVWTLLAPRCFPERDFS